jgi:hypothetical protein
MRFIHWPEGLFILLVMVLPFVATTIWRPDTFLGFLASLGIVMVGGLVSWIGVIIAVATIYDRKER